ncbi:MAG: hypothetical protein Q7V88_07040 [Actinomycetota bacterium]|nr:hypothetical protein [Actinomycetota bacterium]
MTRTKWCWLLLGVAVAATNGCSADDTVAPTTVAPLPITPTTITPTTRPADDAGTTTIDPSTNRGYPRVCLMIPVDAVTAATGAEAATSEEAVFRGTTHCFVRDGAGEKIVSLAAGPSEGFGESAAAADAAPVDGFGDGAVRTDGTLHVLIGDEELVFELYPAAGVDPAATDAVIEAIATDVLSRYEPPLPDDG